MNEGPRGFGILSLSGKFAGGRREVDVSPEATSKRVHVDGTICLGVHLGKRVDSETPVHIGTCKGYVSILRTQPQCRVRVDGAGKGSQQIKKQGVNRDACLIKVLTSSMVCLIL